MPYTDTVTTSNAAPAFLQGGGEMGALMRAYDWYSHPLGDPEKWPKSLQNTLRILLNSAFPMFVWWTDELYMFHNDAYLPALGNKHPDALGAKAHDKWAEIWGDIGAVVEGILKSGNQFYAEDLHLELERKGFPEETYWTFSYSPAFNDAGEVNGIFCACTEVTRTVISKRRMGTLKDISETTALIQTIEQACQITSDTLSLNPHDIPFNLIYLLNGPGTEAKLLGKAGTIENTAVPEVINLADAGPGTVYSIVAQTKQPFVTSQTADSKENQLVTAGFIVPAGAVVLPVLRPGQGQLIGFCISGISPNLEYDTDYINFHQLLIRQFATSITSVQAREEALKRQEYLKDIFQQAPVGITILRGPDYIIDLANPGVCEIWGKEQEKIIGKPVLDVLPEVKDQGIKELLDSVYKTGVPFVANELPVMFNRGGVTEKVYLSFVYHPMYDAHGTITGIIAVAININEQVEARLRIEEMNRELLAINSDLDNFVYSASHDLKAPISNIEGLMRALVEFLPAESLRSEEVQRLLELIQKSVDRFKKAIADLTEVAKVQREDCEDVATVNMAELVENVKLDFETMIREKEAVIEVQLTPDAEIEFSAKNIRSIVYNLFSNALKYSYPGRKPVIRITTEKTPDYVVLSVADNGLGLDVADESKIFSMFKRLHDHVEGSGVGLYIVKRIVENAGGRIELESKLGEGSTFRVYFRR